MAARYTSWAKLVGRYKTAANSIDESTADEHYIAGAEDEIDARLSHAYTVPFTTVPGLIVDLATDLSYVKLKHHSKEVQSIFDRVNKALDGIASGKISLGEGSSGANSAWVSATDHSPFGVDDSINWRRDEAQIDDEESGRDP